jgi:lipopolysaccharide/colanic/teichoic acid biosynthesis glycosyltransferase
VYKKFGKRIFDIVFSVVGLLLFLPILIFIGLLVKLTSSGDMLFKQKRLGKNWKEFTLYKFRSMCQGADKKGIAVTSGNDMRITSIGRILRKYKLDELPQLCNVLKGDISVVGPRPEVFQYASKVKQDYDVVLNVKPGITDYAAIEFRNEESLMEQYENKEKAYIQEVLPKKIVLYKKYIENISFFGDVKIVILTFKSLFH